MDNSEESIYVDIIFVCFSGLSMAYSELDSLPRGTFLQEQNWHLITNCSVMGMIINVYQYFKSIFAQQTKGDKLS